MPPNCTRQVPGVRPIGIGDMARHIMAKAVLQIVKGDLQEATGTKQLCTLGKLQVLKQPYILFMTYFSVRTLKQSSLLTQVMHSTL